MKEDLSIKKCIPCEGNTIPFDVEEIHKYLKKIDGWDVKSNEDKKFYIPVLYDIARMSSYTRGYIDRNKLNLIDKNKNWYE